MKVTRPPLSSFVNGVRVTREPLEDGYSHDGFVAEGFKTLKQKMTVEYLTLICRELGALWRVHYSENSDWSYYLIYNGGHETETGVEIHFRNDFYVETYRDSKPIEQQLAQTKAWKCHITASYPNPPGGAAQVSTQDSPDFNATITTSNAKRIAKLIEGHLPIVQKITQMAHANIVEILRKREIFERRKEFVSQLNSDTRHKPYHGADDRSQAKYDIPFGDGVPGHATVLIYNGSERADVNMTLTVDELKPVLDYIAQLRKITKLDKAAD